MCTFTSPRVHLPTPNPLATRGQGNMQPDGTLRRHVSHPSPWGRSNSTYSIPEQHLPNLFLKPPRGETPEPPEALPVFCHPTITEVFWCLTWLYLPVMYREVTFLPPAHCGLHQACRVAQSRLSMLVAPFQNCWLAQGNSTAITVRISCLYVCLHRQGITLSSRSSKPPPRHGSAARATFTSATGVSHHLAWIHILCLWETNNGNQEHHKLRVTESTG